MEGEQRDCSNVCGTGTQSCTNGIWQACEVAPATEQCSDECGTGTRRCEAGKWGSCEVPNAVRGCNNACGSGLQHCSASKWGVCEVPVATMECADTCGVGKRSCVNGAWGECVGPVVVEECKSVCGSGKRVCQSGAWQACDAPQPRPPILQAVIRDFNDTHPDFERPLPMGVNGDKGIVRNLLGPDDLPVYASSTTTPSTSGQFYFDQWFRDVPGVNRSAMYAIQMQRSATQDGMFVFDNPNFFPIDNQLFGNQVRQHNYHFTLATHFDFRYVGGEVFRFRGDDDLWVFINRRLAIDLGGLHESLRGEVFLDERAMEFGIVPGNRYTLHLFFAERHTIDSNFSIETTIADPGTCP
ncbi:MAG: fibro-slime domain-containing protein [Myxococcota bacterium]